MRVFLKPCLLMNDVGFRAFSSRVARSIRLVSFLLLLLPRFLKERISLTNKNIFSMHDLS